MIRQLPAHHLGVVEIELQTYIGFIDRFDDVGRIVCSVKEIPRHIDVVDRLDQQRDILFSGPQSCVL